MEEIIAAAKAARIHDNIMEMPQQYETFAGTRTIVAIAHRLSTIRNADLILVLEEERFIQRGTHKELIEQEGLYRRLNMAQSEVTLYENKKVSRATA